MNSDLEGATVPLHTPFGGNPAVLLMFNCHVLLLFVSQINIFFFFLLASSDADPSTILVYLIN